LQMKKKLNLWEGGDTQILFLLILIKGIFIPRACI
jgi:hypothetical protein